MVITALTHLAWTEYARGHERACVDLATEALAMIEGLPGWRPRFAAPRALLARQLGTLADLPWPDGPTHDRGDGRPGPLLRPHHAGSGGGCGMPGSRSRPVPSPQRSGSSQAPLSLPPLPEHLQVTELVERGFLACLAGDRLGLDDVTGQLDRRGARGEAMLLHGLGPTSAATSPAPPPCSRRPPPTWPTPSRRAARWRWPAPPS